VANMPNAMIFGKCDIMRIPDDASLPPLLLHCDRLRIWLKRLDFRAF